MTGTILSWPVCHFLISLESNDARRSLSVCLILPWTCFCSSHITNRGASAWRVRSSELAGGRVVIPLGGQTRPLYLGERESDQTSGATVGHRPRRLGTGASSLVGALGSRAVPGGGGAEGPCHPTSFLEPRLYLHSPCPRARFRLQWRRQWRG